MDLIENNLFDYQQAGQDFIIKEDVHKTYITDLVKENKELKNLLRQLFYHRRNGIGTKIEDEVREENFSLWSDIYERLNL